MKNYNVYKKRDGQDWKLVSDIYAENFAEAKRIFAYNMTKDNWEKSNDICWISKEEIDVPGWYDMNASLIVRNENDEPDYRASKMELFCSEESINEGFESWNEDVYTWEVRDIEPDFVWIEDQYDLDKAIEDGYEHLISPGNDRRGKYVACILEERENVISYFEFNEKHPDFMSFPITETLGKEKLFDL